MKYVQLTNLIQISAEKYHRIENCKNLTNFAKQLLSDDYLAVVISRLYVKTMSFSTTIMLHQNVHFLTKFEKGSRSDSWRRIDIQMRNRILAAVCWWWKWFGNSLWSWHLTLETFKSCLFFYVIGFALVLFSGIVEGIVFWKNHNGNPH